MSTTKNEENLLQALYCQLGYPPRLRQEDLDPKFLDWLARVHISDTFCGKHGNDGDLEIAVASHPNTTTATLFYMASQGFVPVWLPIAENPKINLRIARELIRANVKYHDEERVLVALAENPNTPPSILAKLAEVDSVAVQQRVVRHPKTPQKALLKMVKHPREDIRVEAAKRIAA